MPVAQTGTGCGSRLLKKAHLLGPSLRLGARCVVRPAHHERDEFHAWTLRARRPGYSAPPCTLAFLNSLGTSGFFSILMRRRPFCLR